MKKSLLEDLNNLESLNEALNKKQKFLPKSLSWTREEIMGQINDMLQDEDEAPLPIGAFTDMVCQGYVDEMASELYETAGERMVDAHNEIIDKTAKVAKSVIGRK